MIIEVNEAGELIVPAELVCAPPHTLIEAGRQGDSVVLKPADSIAESRTIELLQSLPALPGRLASPAMTFRREEIYGPDGR